MRVIGRRWTPCVGILAVCCGLLLSGPVRAEEHKGRVGFSIGLVSPFGIDAYVSKKWGGLNVRLVNPTNEPIELFTSTYFEDNPTLQFGRRVWLPPQSRMQTWHPLLMPEVGAEVATFPLRTLVMDARQSREVMIRGDSGYLQADSLLRHTTGTHVTGLIDSLSIVTDENTNAAYELLLASRLGEGLNRQIKSLPDRMIPAGDECLQGLDQLVIADGRVVDDAAGLTAIRRWLFAGGHLWVMLDRVDPRALEFLLGDEFACQVVDRVGLNTVRLEASDVQGKIEHWTREYERPVEFVRVMVEDANVAFTIDGWPAAFWKNCGAGRLLVTTLGPQGWSRPRESGDAQQPLSGRRSGRPPQSSASAAVEPAGFAPGREIVLPPMQSLAGQFFDLRPAPLLTEAMLEPQMREYVGYAIPSRWLIVSLLMGLSGLLAGLGTWLWRISRLELLGVIGPGLAIMVSLVLVQLGRHQRQVVPASVSSVQFVQTLPGTDDVRVHGVVGLFSAEAGTATVSAKRGGWLMPEMTGQQGITRRMVWTDLEEWQWENLPETAGLRSATFLHSEKTPERIEALATFGLEGVTGRLQTVAGQRPADVILATSAGRLGVELREDGRFLATSQDVFAGDQFLAASLLSDEQNRRRQTLRNLLTDPLRLDYPAAPQLLFWTDPWDLGFQFGEGRKSFGAALVAVPLKFERPPTGTEMALAAPFLPYRGAIGPDDDVPSGLWDHRHRSWLEKSVPAATWLRFQIPAVLLPVQIKSGRLLVQVTGPVGKLEIAGLRQRKEVVPLKTWIDPVGSLTLEITDRELLSLSSDGGLMLRVSGGDPDRPELTNGDMQHGDKTNFWQIESLTLDLHAKTIDPN